MGSTRPGDPAEVDSRTGYRRYRAEQAIVVQRIVALKALGFTLAQIGPLLHTVPTRDELRGMLALRRAEAEAEQQQASERLAAIEARLLILERSSLMNHPHDVLRKIAPPVRLAAIDRHLDASDERPDRLFAAFGELFSELAALLAAARVTPIGPAWSLYERSDETGLVIHAALPVAVTTADAPVRIIERPELSVASTMHTGDVQHMGVAYVAVMDWMQANALSPAGGAAEISLVWHPDNPDANVTELQLPIALSTEKEV